MDCSIKSLVKAQAHSKKSTGYFHIETKGTHHRMDKPTFDAIVSQHQLCWLNITINYLNKPDDSIEIAR